MALASFACCGKRCVMAVLWLGRSWRLGFCLLLFLFFVLIGFYFYCLNKNARLLLSFALLNLVVYARFVVMIYINCVSIENVKPKYFFVFMPFFELLYAFI